MASLFLNTPRPLQPAVKKSSIAARTPSLGVSANAMFPLRTGGSNHAALQAMEQGKAVQPTAAIEATVAHQPMAKLPTLSPETREQMLADVEYIVRILKGGKPDKDEQTNVLNALRKWEHKDQALSAAERGGRRTPMLDHFLILLKMRPFARSGIRSLWQDQSAIVYDTLWYDLRDESLEEFKRMVKQSETQRTEGAESKETENGAALIAKQEAMGLWGMLKGMGTGLVSMAGPEAAQYIATQFDETAHIFFGHEWDSSEPLVLGMNSGQIGTAGGDVIMQLAMFARAAGAKGGKVLKLLNNLDKLKGAQQLLGELSSAQGVLMSTKGIAELIDAKRKAGEKITADALLHDTAFVNQLVMLLSSGVGIALVVKGAPPSAQQAATRARIGLLLSTLQVTSAVAELSRIAQSDASEVEKEIQYGQVIAGLIPQLVGLVIAGHGHAQAKREATQERQAQARSQEAKTPPVEEPQPEAAASNAMHAPPSETAAPQKKLSAHEALALARKPIADAHQAQMQDEVQNRLAPRDEPAVPADLVAGQREPHFTPPARGGKSKTIGKPHLTLEAARQAYDHVLAETGGQVEAGIWQHPDTAEYVVQLGYATAVGPPDQDTNWRAVQHFHPNTTDVPLWRMPSSADVSLLVRQVKRQGSTGTEMIEYPLPNGRRGRAAYTETTEGKLVVEFIGADGQRVTKTFDKVEDYNDYHPVRKVAADTSIRAEADARVEAQKRGRLGNTPVEGELSMHARAPKKAAGPKPSAAKVASAREGKNKVPTANDHDFSDVAAELALPDNRPPQKKGTPPPALELKPPSRERQVAVRFRGDSKTKGHFIVGPELPTGQDVFKVGKAAYLKNASDKFKAAAANPAFIVLPESQARAMGFIGREESFTSPGKVQTDTVAPTFTPYQKEGKTLESSKAETVSHPFAARTSSKRNETKRKQAWSRTIAPSLEENESYKYLLTRNDEYGLKRPSNATERGADHITVDLSSDPPKIFLNDATTPEQAKKPKSTHKDWLADFKKDFPVNAQGVRDFGFNNPQVNAKINKAIDVGEIYTRTLRPSEIVNIDGVPMREYLPDPPVKVEK